jgi:diguanylate cyclase (GGDEF)-like protein
MPQTVFPRRLLDSAFARLIVAAAASSILMTAVFAVLVFENEISLIAENALLRSVRVAIDRREQVESLAASGTGLAEGLQGLRDEAPSLGIRQLTVLSSEGDVLYSLDPKARQVGSVASVAELRAVHRALTRRDFQNSLFTHSLDEQRRAIVLEVPFGSGKAGGVINLEFEIAYIDSAIGRLRRQAMALGGCVTVLLAVFVFVAHRLLVSPLYRLIQATQAVAGGQFELALPPSRTYEIRTLVDSFLAMSNALNEMQKDARAANPLTGLPGNIAIERTILKQLQAGVPFAVLYCDLDNFKAYNDRYGFSRGDDIILYTRDCLVKACESSTHDYFIGHQGGDDFVVVCKYEDWEKVASAIVTLFDHGVGRFYNAEDRTAGYIVSKDRQDREQRFPLASISVAAASNTNRRFESFGEIVDVVAEVKHLVKSKPGSVYAIDRRGEQA